MGGSARRSQARAGCRRIGACARAGSRVARAVGCRRRDARRRRALPGRGAGRVHTGSTECPRARRVLLDGAQFGGHGGGRDRAFGQDQVDDVLGGAGSAGGNDSSVPSVTRRSSALRRVCVAMRAFLLRMLAFSRAFSRLSAGGARPDRSGGREAASRRAGARGCGVVGLGQGLGVAEPGHQHILVAQAPVRRRTPS